ncbi:predicted protein [Chaetomium globosum CBS 148.51]|uniref:F-box domain-containing protein n=1 Tax=Chaetomium globosum (strain ATCC 6205 / CBS 148.51 / DSM 1962 / NBRC 6347 / NRRL 1970) TaxID=306901 RepID=Q2GMN6_CHAGB|nr:uncharacterized protein CHGG_10768 [Chaetomium globosum CBS 148.51]EAQ82950.1 predicted protein [Chaetomium globosum CBS 148.51]
MAADSHLPGILRLSPEIRRHIYLDLDLGQIEYYAHTAPAIYQLGGPASSRIEGEDFRPAAFYGLLLSCRTIYLEASSLLYSENWFIIYYEPLRSLSSLRALTPHALASLTNLKVVLNQTSCHVQGERYGSGYCCGRGWASGSGQGQPKVSDPKLLRGCLSQYHEDDHDFPLDRSNTRAEEVLAEWQKTAFYLAPHIVPGRLELSLVCDVRNTEVQIARRVLDGLYLLPRLKDCHVRLSETSDKRLQHITDSAVLRARHIISSEPPPSPGPSSPMSLSTNLSPAAPLNPPGLLTLPREIRLRILEYTDLVTPSKEVMWHRKVPNSGYFLQRAPCYTDRGGGFCDVSHCNGCQFTQCYKTPWTELTNGCFCRLNHTAASSRCKCWVTPTSLFLVCQTVYSEANVVFYTQNRFIIVDSPWNDPCAYWDPGDYPFQSFAASQFLRNVIPRHCLGHLRFLELTFSQFTSEARPSDGHPALLDWDATVEWLKDELNLPALTLRLVVTGHDDPDRGSHTAYYYTREQGKEVLATYNRILHPLRLLGAAPDGGLARFYAVLPWPLKWSRLAKEQLSVKGWDWLDSKDAELKKRAEKFVMGDRYESVSLAVVEPRKSLWYWDSLRFC